jgi:hypothetical protein
VKAGEKLVVSVRPIRSVCKKGRCKGRTNVIHRARDKESVLAPGEAEDSVGVVGPFSEGAIFDDFGWEGRVGG